MKKIGFLSFGHWTPSSQSQTRSAADALLQSIDLATLANLDALATAQAEAEGIPRRSAEVARLVRNAASSDAVKRAVASGRYWREVPVGAPIGGVVLEGFIDLLYEGADGLVVARLQDRLGLRSRSHGTRWPVPAAGCHLCTAGWCDRASDLW